MGFSRQEYWSGWPFPFPGDLPDPGIKPVSPESPALACRFFTSSATWEARYQLGEWLNAFRENCLVLSPVGTTMSESREWPDL